MGRRRKIQANPSPALALFKEAEQVAGGRAELAQILDKTEEALITQEARLRAGGELRHDNRVRLEAVIKRRDPATFVIATAPMQLVPRKRRSLRWGIELLRNLHHRQSGSWWEWGMIMDQLEGSQQRAAAARAKTSEVDVPRRQPGM